MIVNIELENDEDFIFIKQLLEKIKGVKSVSVKEEEEFYEDGTPKWVIDKLADYADRLEDKDMVSEEEFFSNARKKACELYSRK
ncbi:hypothetical protein [Chryseobacterium cheonjiense]|jgi:hypothetical protein|uniref:Uncharacterized protein n=1 Tax=Chryseobacterium cheonjiense TaxID=2728845 RepID=A0A7Y0A8W0_9FLAO|nr:hypothetical protein [Chryseobacterium cheonjiense]NML58860.1 hypothetical protein [Chryseobacterium cheonjiense]